MSNALKNLLDKTLSHDANDDAPLIPPVGASFHFEPLDVGVSKQGNLLCRIMLHPGTGKWVIAARQDPESKRWGTVVIPNYSGIVCILSRKPEDDECVVDITAVHSSGNTVFGTPRKPFSGALASLADLKSQIRTVKEPAHSIDEQPPADYKPAVYEHQKLPVDAIPKVLPPGAGKARLAFQTPKLVRKQ